MKGRAKGPGGHPRLTPPRGPATPPRTFPRACRPPTRWCGPCDWCDGGLRLVSWRPVRLPRRVRGARARPRPAARRPDAERLEHPSPEYATQARTREEATVVEQARTDSHSPCCAARGPQRAGSGRPRVFGALGRGVAAVWLGIAHAIGAVARSDRPQCPRPRARAPSRRRRAVPDRPRRRRRGRRVVAAARCGHGGGAHRRRRVGRQGRLAGAADAGADRLAQHARPRAQRSGRPAGRRLGRPRLRACSASCTSPTATRSPSSATPATSSRPEEPSGYVVASLLLDLLRTPYVVVPLLVLLCVVRRAGDHRDPRLPGARIDSARCATVCSAARGPTPTRASRRASRRNRSGSVARGAHGWGR